MKVLSVFGTRPEAIKFAPVLQALARHAGIVSRVCVTAQHRQMLDQVLSVFSITPDIDLDLMRPGQSLDELTVRLLSALAPIMASEKPDLVLVQGDTTTSLAGGLSAYYAKVPVAHVEAGLRTGDMYSPFPEEMNRRVVDAIATWRYAPTERSKNLLLAEGCEPASVLVTGNTVVDAIHWARDYIRKHPVELPFGLEGSKLVLVTAHRRESFGEGIAGICRAVADVARSADDVTVVFPIHPNPNVLEPARRILGQHEGSRIHVTDPVDYLTLVRLLDRASLVITDSGGIQEEAASLGIPLLVARDKTERPEVLDVTTTQLVGTLPETITTAALQWLSRTKARMEGAHSGPFGDGTAGEKIAEHILSLR